MGLTIDGPGGDDGGEDLRTGILLLVLPGSGGGV